MAMGAGEAARAAGLGFDLCDEAEEKEHGKMGGSTHAREAAVEAVGS